MGEGTEYPEKTPSNWALKDSLDRSTNLMAIVKDISIFILMFCTLDQAKSIRLFGCEVQAQNQKEHILLTVDCTGAEKKPDGNKMWRVCKSGQCVPIELTIGNSNILGWYTTSNEDRTKFVTKKYKDTADENTTFEYCYGFHQPVPVFPSSEHPCDNFDCENGGTCSVSLTTGQAECKCFGDFSGLNCEVSPCAPQLCPFCFHGGTCTVNANGQATCLCAGDLTGDRCSTTPCMVGYNCGTGTCYLNNRRAACACPAGYTGTHCETGPCDYDAGLNHYFNCH